MEQYFTLLLHSQLFKGVQQEEIRSILQCLGAVKRGYKKGEYIYQIGDTASSVALLLKGEVHIQHEDYWGNQTIISEITPGVLFGETYALLPNAPLTVNAFAVTDCTVLFLKAFNIISPCEHACRFHNILIRNLVTALAGKNLILTGKLEHMAQRSTRNKLLSYLSLQSIKAGSPSFDIPFNRQQLADYLAVDRSAMSNELGKLRDEGLLEFDKSHFRLI
jgi:CRP/FNR family transcriptional regulator, dissimilatory nitrate respiration regulator